MAQVLQSVNGVTQSIADIAHTTREQNSGIAQVSQAMSNLERVTQDNAAMVARSGRRGRRQPAPTRPSRPLEQSTTSFFGLNSERDAVPLRARRRLRRSLESRRRCRCNGARAGGVVESPPPAGSAGAEGFRRRGRMEGGGEFLGRRCGRAAPLRALRNPEAPRRPHARARRSPCACARSQNFFKCSATPTDARRDLFGFRKRARSGWPSSRGCPGLMPGAPGGRRPRDGHRRRRARA